jgi:hypothetical protein
VRSLYRPVHLWLLLCHYKVYPVSRTEPDLLSRKGSGRNFLWRMYGWAKHLAQSIDEMQVAWDARFNNNRLPHIFNDMVTGSIDTFPIYIQRPPNALQRQYYNGKYGGHVLKVKCAQERLYALTSADERTLAHACYCLTVVRCRRCAIIAETLCGTVGRT